jgi:hypothetical protein
MLFIQTWTKLAKISEVQFVFVCCKNSQVNKTLPKIQCLINLHILLMQILIVDLNLPYPSGLATAVLINGFHTQDDKMAKYYKHLLFIL